MGESFTKTKIDIKNCKIAIRIDEFYKNKNNDKYML